MNNALNRTGGGDQAEEARVLRLFENIRSQRGDEDVNNEFYALCRSVMERTAWMRFRLDSFMAEDSIQDSFIKILEAIREGRFTYEGATDFRGWIQRVFINTYFDSVRRKRPGVGTEKAALDDHIYGLHAPGDNPEQALSQKETRRLLHRMAKTLPAEFREILLMRDFQDQSYEQIATALGVSDGTVKSRINRARAMLKEKLANYR